MTRRPNPCRPHCWVSISAGTYMANWTGVPRGGSRGTRGCHSTYLLFLNLLFGRSDIRAIAHKAKLKGGGLTGNNNSAQS
jgi:hypothetical protein